MTNNNFAILIERIQPIINSCAGFIKTDGYMTHIPGFILMMDASESYFSIIKLPFTEYTIILAEINTLMSLKTPDKRANADNLYFNGNNLVYNKLISYYSMYNDIDNKSECIYSSPDCMRLDGFNENVSMSTIGKINVSDGKNNYRIPVSKAITPITKNDSVSLNIYNSPDTSDNIKIVQFIIKKKKFKVTIEIFSNIMILQ